MKQPFTTAQFLEVFKSYNTSLWPFQFLFLLFAVIGVFGLILKPNTYGKPVMYFLAALWMWMGVVYHGYFFSIINKAAFIFGFFFLLQSFLFLFFTTQRKITFEFRNNIKGFTSICIILYALVLYPVVGAFDGHTYPGVPTFGLPCPTTIFTFGILLMIKNKIPVYLLLIPLAWSLIGISAALNLGMIEDFGLIISALLTTLLLFHRHEKVTYIPKKEIPINHYP